MSVKSESVQKDGLESRKIGPVSPTLEQLVENALWSVVKAVVLGDSNVGSSGHTRCQVTVRTLSCFRSVGTRRGEEPTGGGGMRRGWWN